MTFIPGQPRLVHALVNPIYLIRQFVYELTSHPLSQLWFICVMCVVQNYYVKLCVIWFSPNITIMHLISITVIWKRQAQSNDKQQNTGSQDLHYMMSRYHAVSCVCVIRLYFDKYTVPKLQFFQTTELSKTSRFRKLIFGLQVNIDKARYLVDDTYEATCPTVNFSTPCLSQRSFKQVSSHTAWRLI